MLLFVQEHVLDSIRCGETENVDDADASTPDAASVVLALRVLIAGQPRLRNGSGEGVLTINPLHTGLFGSLKRGRRGRDWDCDCDAAGDSQQTKAKELFERRQQFALARIAPAPGPFSFSEFVNARRDKRQRQAVDASEPQDQVVVNAPLLPAVAVGPTSDNDSGLDFSDFSDTTTENDNITDFSSDADSFWSSDDSDVDFDSDSDADTMLKKAGAHLRALAVAQNTARRLHREAADEVLLLAAGGGFCPELEAPQKSILTVTSFTLSCTE